MDDNRVHVICSDCGADTTVAKNTYRQNKNKNPHYRCAECYSKYRSSVSKQIWKDQGEEGKKKIYAKAANSRKNKSPEEKENIKKKIQKTWSNKSPEEMEIYKAKSAERTTQFWATLSNERREEIRKISSAAQLSYINNMTDDEKNAYKAYRSSVTKNMWNNLSYNERSELISKMSDGTKHQWEKYSDEERKLISSKISEGRKQYWENMSTEDRVAFGNNHKKWWESLSEEERNLHFLPMRVGYRAWYDTLSDDEKQCLSESRSKSSREYWDNMTSDEKDEWTSKRLDGFNKYFNSLNVNPNKNELSFINYINRYSIDYRYQYYNTMKHSDFDKLFPFNPVTSAKIVLPYHQWDFIIHTNDGDILVDIDGSIHDKNKSSYNVTYYNGKKVNIKDVIGFNDAQRPFQTDGLPAYIVQCYDDNLTDNTPVQNINTGEIMTLISFIALILFMNMSNDQKKELIQTSV